MKRIDLYNVSVGIKQCSNLEGYDFLAKLVIISNKIDEVIKAYETVKPKTSDEYKEYIEKKNELLDKHVLKDKDNNYLSNQNGYAIGNPYSYNKALDALNTEYDKVIKKEEAQIKSYNEWLEADAVELEIKVIPFEDVPKNINFGTLKLISPIVDFKNVK